jgi:hypothetical protein
MFFFLYTKTMFWIPPESSAKIVLGMNIFSGIFLLILLLVDLVPLASNAVPYIGMIPTLI